MKNATDPDIGCLMTVAAANRRPYPVSTSPFSRLRSEGIRAVCNGDPEKRASSGFNLILPWERLLKDSKKTTPPDARCNAQIVDAKDNHILRSRLFPKDSLEPLSAITGLKPVMLNLTVYPSMAEPVILEEVQICFTTKSR